MLLRIPTVIVSLLLLLNPTQSAAAEAEAEADFAAGKQAFAAGDYQSALVFFETARDAGLAGPAVLYNIAVCQFELTDYAAAGATFRSIGERFPRMRALAEYNQGLVARRLGDAGAARGHFAKAYRLGNADPKIRALAAKALNELDPGWATPPAWTGSLGVRIGHDSNVALRDELGLPAGTTADSPMADVFATVQGPWTADNGFRLDASAYLVRFFDADDFDQAELLAGGLYDWRGRGWRILGGAHYGYGTLGGETFEQGFRLTGRLIRYMDASRSLEARLRYDDIDAPDETFSGIEGTRQRLDLRYRWFSADRMLALRYGLETNDRVSASVSPTRHVLGADYRFQPASGWGYEAGILLRRSDYDDLATPRTEDLYSIGAAVTRTLPQAWLLMLQFRYSDNDSSDPAFSYDRTQISLGVFRLF